MNKRRVIARRSRLFDRTSVKVVRHCRLARGRQLPPRADGSCRQLEKAAFATLRKRLLPIELMAAIGGAVMLSSAPAAFQSAQAAGPSDQNGDLTLRGRVGSSKTLDRVAIKLIVICDLHIRLEMENLLRILKKIFDRRRGQSRSRWPRQPLTVRSASAGVTPQRQQQLHANWPACEVFDKLSHRLGHFVPFGDPLLQFVRHVLRGITRPALQRIESHHAQRVVVLTGQEVADQNR